MFDIVRLLQKKEELDIFDSAKDLDGSCVFSGPKEILKWFVNLSLARGYDHTVDDFVRLALSIVRSSHHNVSELVNIIISHIPQSPILGIKDRYDNNMLHMIASKLGGILFPKKIDKWRIQVWDEGFEFEEGSVSRCSLSRQKWSSLLQSFNINQVDLHPTSKKRTPMTRTFDSLIANWNGSKSKLIDALSKFLQLWLLNLAKLGTCLRLYGNEERRLQDEDLVRKDFNRFILDPVEWQIAPDYSFGTMRLIGFASNASANEWKLWWSEPTDEFAGDFWRLCEDEPTRIPGAWNEEFGTF